MEGLRRDFSICGYSGERQKAISRIRVGDASSRHDNQIVPASGGFHTQWSQLGIPHYFGEKFDQLRKDTLLYGIIVSPQEHMIP